MIIRRTGETEPIQVYAVDGNSAPLTGLTDLYVRLRRDSDGFLYDWADNTWKGAGWTTLNKLLAEIDATNLPGYYEVTGGFDHTAATNEVANDQYTVYAIQTPGTSARLPGPKSFMVGYWVDQIFTEVADTVWDESLAAHTGVGSTGKALTDVLAGDIIADKVWDESLAAHTSVGSTGESLANIESGAGIADAVWDEILPGGHIIVNSAGLFVQQLDAAVSSRAAPGDAMDLVTDAVDADALALSAAQEIRDQILSDSTPFAGANIDAAISSRAAPGAAMDLVIDAVDAGALAASAVAEIADGVLDELLAGHALAGSVGEALSRLDVAVSTRAATGSPMDLVADAVDATALATSAVTEIAAGVWNALTATYAAAGTMGQAQGRLDVAVSTRAAPGAAMTLTVGERGAVTDAVWDELLAGHTIVGSTGEALQSSGGAPTVGQIADAVWDEPIAAHLLAGSAGLYQSRLDQTISSRAAPADQMDLIADAVDATSLATSAVTEIRNGILSDGTPFAGANIDAAISSRSAPGDAMDLVTDAVDAAALAASAVAEIADGVWLEPIADHSGTVGSTAEALANAAASVSPGAIADAVWDEPLAGHVAAGSAGEAQGRLDATISSRAAPGAAMDLVADALDATALAASAVTEIQAAILSDATPFAGANIDASIASRAVPGDLMGLSVAGINALLDAALAGHGTLGTVGKALLNVDAQVSTRAAAGDAMGLTLAGAQAAAGAVWDETLASHLTTGSTGRKLSDLIVAPTAGVIAAAVWDESLALHTLVGSAGEAQARLDVAVSTRAAPGDDMGLTLAGAEAAADQVWIEQLADHVGVAGSTAEALANTDPVVVAASVWDALLADHNLADTFGGAINASLAAVSGASQVTITIQDQGGAPIQGAQVDVYDSTNTFFITRYFTDVLGQFTMAINDGLYALRIFASGYAFVVPELLTVAGNGSETFVGQSFLSPTPPSSPDKCVIVGQVVDGGGNPIAGAEVDAYAVTPQVGGGYIIGPQIASTITNAAGYFELELLIGITVNFAIPDVNVSVIRVVPDAPFQWYTTWAA